MLGNKLLKFGKSIFGADNKYSKVSDNELGRYKQIAKSFKNRKKQFGDKFDVNKWASSWSELDDNAIQFFSNIKDGDNILEGLANTMGKTTKAVTSSGKEIQLTGNKFKDFGIKAKDSFSTFGKIAKNGLKSFGAGLAGTLANVGLNLLIGTVLDKAISAWQEYSNVQENAISKSQEAFSAMQENQNKIKNAQSVLDSIKENTVLDSSGNEITRFEQLSRGVNSLGENVSLTKSEFEEYNSILNSMTGAGLNATTSMANLEKQVKDLRRNANSDSLTGLGDWVEGFNAKNNQMYTNATKEVGFQQKLSALNKIYNDPEDASDKIEQVTQMGFWEKLANNIATGEMAIAAGQTASEEARESLLNSADKIRDELVASETDIKALEEIAKEYSIDIFDDNGKIDYGKYKSDKVQEQLADVRANLESQVESMVRESSGFLQAMFENSPEFESISSSAANAIGQIFGNIDYDTISKYMSDSNGMLSQQMMKDWVKGISEGAKDKGVQEQLSQLFNLDAESNNKTFKEYEKQANQLLNGITQKVPGISKELLKNATGIEDTLNSASTSYKRVTDTVGKEFADLLNLKDLDLAAEIISQQDIKNAEQLKQALLLAKEAAFDINANPIFDSIKAADETRNKGDDYIDALKYAKEAKEMYDKGLIGTDDFKARAKYLSPTGAEDPANFIENYGKATRYLTEDSSGVKNFLTDLSKKTDDAGNSLASFDKATGKWSYNIKDLSQAAHDMGMGFEFFMDMFGRLEDYGFSNNFFSSEKEGVEKLTDKISKLAKAKRELAELESRGENQTAINAKKEEIAALEQDQQQIRENLKQVAQESAESINDQITASKDAYKALKEERDKILANPDLYGENTDEVVAKMDEQLKELAQQGMFEIDGEMNIVNKDEVKEEIESEFESEPLQLAIDTESSFKDLKEAAQESLSTVQQMVNFESPFVKLNLDSMDTLDLQNQIVAVSSAMERLKNEDGTINISAPGAQDAINVLAALITKKQELSQPTIMSISTDSLDADLAAVVSKLQEFQQAYNELEKLNTLKQAGVDVDTSAAEAKVSSLKSELENMEGTQANIKAELDIDTTTIESTLESIKNITAQDLGAINVGATVTGKEELDALKSSIDSVQGKTEEVKADVKGKDDVDALKSSIDAVQGKTVSVTANVTGTSSVNSLASAINSLKDKSITVTTTHVSKKEAGKASGTMLSPAHVNGTAYNTLNMSSAHAGGNVAIQRDEKSLINEVGMESIVRDGIWRLIPGGAHFEQLKKGDIVFNASQTEQLLKYGSISGHGIAYADGTVGNVRDLVRKPLSAYAGGAGGGVLGAGGSGSQANFGGGNSNKGNSNKATNTANQISKNTKKTADTVKDISNELSNYEDWVERRFKAIESEFAHLEAVFERITHLPDKLAKAYELLAKNKDYMNTVNDSKATYQSHLDKIKGQGLSQDIIDKIEMGSLEISSYSEETQKLISEYETYYNKLRDCTAQYDELLAKQSELVESTLDSVSDYYEMINNVDEASKAVFEAQRELYENLGISVTSKSQSDSLNKSIAEQEKITNRLTAQIEAYKAQIDTLVSSGYMEVNSKEYFAAHEALNQMNKELAESKSALIEFQDQLYELEYTGIQNIIDRFEQAVDKLDAKISYIKSKDEKVSENLYQEQINANNSQIREKMQLKAKKEKEQSLYEVGSTRYQELAEEINNLDKETYGLLTTNEELKDSIFELRFADLEEGIKGYQDLRNEIEDFKSLLNEEAFFDKGGSITEDGLANLALLQQQMASAKQEIADYRTGLDKLQESFDNGVISETEYNEKSAEYREGIRNSIKDIKDYEDSLTDLYMTQMSKENEALQKTIDQYAEARKRKASYFEYDKKLKGQQKSVDMLKAQIAALEGVKIFALCVLIAGTPLEFYKLQRKNEICLSVNV